MLTMRPGTAGVGEVAVGTCDQQRPPQAKTTQPPPNTTTTRDHSADLQRVTESEPPSWFPSDWSALHWIAILTPVCVLVTVCLCVYFRWRRSSSRRVHVAPETATESRAFKRKSGQVQWDFAEAGVISVDDLQAAKEALHASVKEEVSGKLELGSVAGKRCLSFWASNRLHAPLIVELEGLLARYSGLTISFDRDWRQANDPTLTTLARMLLKMRGRCKFRTNASQHLLPLRLPVAAASTALAGVCESLASFHAEVDAVSLEMPSENQQKEEFYTLQLTPLRMSSQSLVLNREAAGDAGVAAACGFVKSWSARLQIVRLVECSIGDAGASSVARLVGNGRTPAVGLRELNLCANMISDRGVSDIADALPVLDSLSKLLLERNRIGPVGARALAERLPRSSVRELYLGSHLGGNPIEEQGVKALALALDDLLPRAAANRTDRLNVLSLEACGVGEVGAAALAEVLPKSSLTMLSLARGSLRDSDAEAVLRALPNTVLSLDLAGNELSDLTGSLVGEVFYEKPKLAVSLAQNYLTPTVRMLLQEEHGTRLRV